MGSTKGFEDEVVVECISKEFNLLGQLEYIHVVEKKRGDFPVRFEEVFGNGPGFALEGIESIQRFCDFWKS